MASTYENDLRLEEMATGENSGSWGTKTNTNLELIADAFSYGTETIANADTTITIADGAADAARSLALKINSSADLTTTRTITLAPNTTSKVWIIENNTSGGQTLTISAGSGTNITLLNGQTKIIATDGIGAGSNVVELTQDLAIADLFIDDDLSLQSDGGILKIGADADLQVTHSGSAGTITNSTGDLTVDVAGDIILDADGKQIIFADGGTQFGQISTNSTPADMAIKSLISDEDIIFQGIDNGSSITALTLDMSEAGRATFNDVVRIPTNLEHDGDADTFFGFPGANNFVITAGNVSRVYGSASETVINEDSANLDFRVESDNQTHMLFVDAGNGRIGINESAPDATFHLSNSQANSASQGMILEGTWPWLKFLDTENNQNTFAIYNDSALYFTRLAYADRNNAPNGGVDSLILYETQAVFNEDSADIDFRVESDNNANMLFVDAGNDHVNIGSSTDRGGLLNVDGTTKGIVVRTTNSAAMELIHADNGAGTGPIMYLNRPSSGPAADDQLGRIVVQGKNSADEVIDYVRLVNQLLSPTDGSEQGRFAINTMTSGTQNSRLNIVNGESVFNDESVNVDFRVESDANANFLLLDASAEMLLVGGGANTAGGAAFKVTQSNDGELTLDSTSSESNIVSYDRNGSAYHPLNIYGSNVNINPTAGNAAIFNEASLDADFRVESDNVSNMLQVDAGNNRLNIGGSPQTYSSNRVNIYGDNVNPPGAANGNLAVYAVDSQASGNGGSISLGGRYTDAGAFYQFGAIQAVKKNSTSGNAAGLFKLYYVNSSNGTNPFLEASEDETVFNNAGLDDDFRVESNNNANMLLVDAGNDVVNINNTGTNKRFRVDSGNITTAAFNYVDASDVSLMQIKHARASGGTNATMIQFQDSGGTERGTIKTTGSATTFNTSSDYRLKENVVYDWDATTRLKQLKPARFNFIAEPDTTVEGFLAHEAQAVVPKAVTGTHNQVDDNGDAVMQGIDQSVLVPLLVKTIQELEARITALENA